MTESQLPHRLSRRQALKLAAGGVAGGALIAAAPQLPGLSSPSASAAAAPTAALDASTLPVKRIEAIIQVEGNVSNGVLNIEVDRDDLTNVVKLPQNIPIKPSFELNGNLCFQALNDGSAMFNGDLAFKASELNPAIAQALSHGITWQAEHQHLFDLSPMVWFMHFRARGNPLTIAKGLAAILSVTSTPLPQAPPSNPTTPLNADRLGEIIGAPATVGADGVVSILVPRADCIILDGVHISPYLNVFIPVDFQPVAGGTVVVPDFGMIYEEIPALTRVMQSKGWQVNCLYNQETDEHPQLYFSHHFKVGDAYQLANEVRAGLNQLDVTLQS